MNEQEMLNVIAKVIEIYEDPTGYNCSNNVCALISIAKGVISLETKLCKSSSISGAFDISNAL